MSYTVNIQHIVFRTLHSRASIPHVRKGRLIEYIKTVSENMGAYIYQVNTYLNHVHMLVDLPPTLSISEFVRKIKQTSSSKFKGDEDFPNFEGWASQYGSFSVSIYNRDKVINYIKGQEEHHRYKTFAEELEKMFGIDYIVTNPYWKRDWVE